MLCNICGKKASSRCSKCKKRVYCSRECQRSDYKVHKQYCRPPITDRDRLKELEVLYKSLSTPPPFGFAVDAPGSVVADVSNLERTFWAAVAPEWPVVPYKEWPGLFEKSSEVGKELDALPRSSPFAGAAGHGSYRSATLASWTLKPAISYTISSVMTRRLIHLPAVSGS